MAHERVQKQSISRYLLLDFNQAFDTLMSLGVCILLNNYVHWCYVILNPRVEYQLM